jgi:hypothetical protein
VTKINEATIGVAVVAVQFGGCTTHTWNHAGAADRRDVGRLGGVNLGCQANKIPC